MGVVDVSIHIFLSSALGGGEWSASRPTALPPSTHWIGGWVGQRTGLDDMKGRKILPLAGLEHDLLAIQPVDSRNTDCAFLALGGIKTSAKVGHRMKFP
jgi:hypothetical protein